MTAAEYRPAARARLKSESAVRSSSAKYPPCNVSAASGRARAERAAATREPAPGASARSSRTIASSRSTVSSRLRQIHRARPPRRAPARCGLVVGGGRRQRDEDRRDPPRAQLGGRHRAGARDREVGRGVRVGDRRRGTARTRTRPPSSERDTRRSCALPVAQIRWRSSGMPRSHPVGDARVHRAEPWLPPNTSSTRPPLAGNPHCARAPARSGRAARRRLDRISGVDSRACASPAEQRVARLGKAEVDLARPAAERRVREAREAVLLLHARSGCRARRAYASATPAA